MLALTVPDLVQRGNKPDSSAAVSLTGRTFKTWLRADRESGYDRLRSANTSANCWFDQTSAATSNRPYRFGTGSVLFGVPRSSFGGIAP